MSSSFYLCLVLELFKTTFKTSTLQVLPLDFFVPFIMLFIYRDGLKN